MNMKKLKEGKKMRDFLTDMLLIKKIISIKKNLK